MADQQEEKREPTQEELSEQARVAEKHRVEIAAGRRNEDGSLKTSEAEASKPAAKKATSAAKK